MRRDALLDSRSQPVTAEGLKWYNWKESHHLATGLGTTVAGKNQKRVKLAGKR